MTEKVKLTQKQFDWLERYKSEEEINYAIDIQLHRKRPDSPVADWKPSEVAQAFYNGYEVEPEYKYGDWVTKHYSDLSYLIGRVNQVRSDGMVGVYCSDENIVFIPCEEVSASTPEEIKAEKERRLWVKIGREVGEFKDGDFGEHVSGREQSESQEYLSDWYKRGRLKGFFPAESFISFEEGESDECETCQGKGEVFQESGAGIHATANLGWVACPDCEDCHADDTEADSNA